jgi:hypothetical protein
MTALSQNQKSKEEEKRRFVPQVKKTGFLKPFIYINDHFTKTGSGQT